MNEAEAPVRVAPVRRAFPKPNEHGVFVCEDCFSLISFKSPRVEARAEYLQIGVRLWAWGYDYRIGNWEAGCSGVSAHDSISTETEAIVKATSFILKRLVPAASGKRSEGYTPEVQRHARRAMEEILSQVSADRRKLIVEALLEGAKRG